MDVGSPASAMTMLVLPTAAAVVPVLPGAVVPVPPAAVVVVESLPHPNEASASTTSATTSMAAIGSLLKLLTLDSPVSSRI